MVTPEEDCTPDAATKEHGREELATHEAETERRASREQLDYTDADQRAGCERAVVGASEEVAQKVCTLAQAKWLQLGPQPNEEAPENGLEQRTERGDLVTDWAGGAQAEQPIPQQARL